jgi:hypothetical protein
MLQSDRAVDRMLRVVLPAGQRVHPVALLERLGLNVPCGHGRAMRLCSSVDSGMQEALTQSL